MDGEDGGVAASLMAPVGEPWDGGEVEGTAKLTATPSSGSPGGEKKGQVLRKGYKRSSVCVCVCFKHTPSPVGDCPDSISPTFTTWKRGHARNDPRHF